MLSINETECVGCGACVSACPAGFELVGVKARVKDETASCVADAISACPRGAIVRLTQAQVPQPVTSSSMRVAAVRAPGGVFGRGRLSPGRGRGGRQRGGGRRRGRR
jgi:ferredoxin